LTDDAPTVERILPENIFFCTEDTVLVVAQFDKEASQTPRWLRRQERDASRGSPRSLAAQKALARDDNQTEPLPPC